MVLWLSNKSAREKLFNKGRVYILRAKPHIGKEELVKGEEDVVWDTPTIRDKRVAFTYIGKMKSDDELREYLPLSGYLTIEEWRKDSKRNKHLFMLKVLDFIKKVKW